jgi:hypothetical protein
MLIRPWPPLPPVEQMKPFAFPVLVAMAGRRFGVPTNGLDAANGFGNILHQRLTLSSIVFQTITHTLDELRVCADGMLGAVQGHFPPGMRIACRSAPALQAERRTMRPKVRFQCLCLWLILGLASTDATAASFSARMTTTREGKTQTGTFFLQDQRYRMEVQENGHPVVVIADQAKNRHWIINVMEANYFKIASDDFSVLSNDPFKTSDYIAAKYGIRSEGTETVAGFSCDRQQAQVQDTKVMTRWYASELDFPIKIIMHQGKQDAVVELTAIAQAPRKASCSSRRLASSRWKNRVLQPSANAGRPSNKRPPSPD